MNKSLADIRTDYSKARLNIEETAEDPIEQFQQWFREAQEAKVHEVNAMNLSTASADGRPSSRIVLLKEITEKGFAFYTNYESSKGRQIAENPFAAITFFWPELERQVRLEGRVEKISAELSDEYFSSRPRASQLGAWASPQSREIPDRKILEEREKSYKEKFGQGPIPRPPHWGGYELIPDHVEFWQGRPSRLHDRLVYEKDVSGWVRKRLAP
jgi:pyridoxamine 5'-phosphate oxidase